MRYHKSHDMIQISKLSKTTPTLEKRTNNQHHLVSIKDMAKGKCQNFFNIFNSKSTTAQVCTIHKTLLGAIYISLMFIEFSNFVKREKNDENLLSLCPFGTNFKVENSFLDSFRVKKQLGGLQFECIVFVFFNPVTHAQMV